QLHERLDDRGEIGARVREHIVDPAPLQRSQERFRDGNLVWLGAFHRSALAAQFGCHPSPEARKMPATPSYSSQSSSRDDSSSPIACSLNARYAAQCVIRSAISSASRPRAASSRSRCFASSRSAYALHRSRKRITSLLFSSRVIACACRRIVTPHDSGPVRPRREPARARRRRGQQVSSEGEARNTRPRPEAIGGAGFGSGTDRKSTRLNSSHVKI